MTGETARTRKLPGIEWAMSPTERILANELWSASHSLRSNSCVIGNNRGARPWQFFDLQSDSFEMSNLWQQQSPA